jgi:hypothetical protein
VGRLKSQLPEGALADLEALDTTLRKLVKLLGLQGASAAAVQADLQKRLVEGGAALATLQEQLEVATTARSALEARSASLEATFREENAHRVVLEGERQKLLEELASTKSQLEKEG